MAIMDDIERMEALKSIGSRFEWELFKSKISDMNKIIGAQQLEIKKLKSTVEEKTRRCKKHVAEKSHYLKIIRESQC